MTGSLAFKISPSLAFWLGALSTVEDFDLLACGKMRFEFQRILKGETLNLPGREFQLSLEEMPPWSQRQVSFDNKIRNKILSD